MMNKHISKTKLIIKGWWLRGKGCITRLHCASLSHYAIGAPQSAQLCQSDAVKSREKEQGGGQQRERHQWRVSSSHLIMNVLELPPSTKIDNANGKWQMKLLNSANDTHNSLPPLRQPPSPPHVIVNSSLQLWYETETNTDTQVSQLAKRIMVYMYVHMYMVIYSSNNNYNYNITNKN